jgi:hypothetical protein
MMRLKGDHWQGPPTDEDRLPPRLPGYVPELVLGATGPGRALLAIAGRYLRLLTDRLAHAPDKARLEFLTRLGLTTTPPQAARAPVVFELLPSGGHSRAPAGTRVGAASPGGGTVPFETEETIGLAASRLMEVRTILPRSGTAADHSLDALGGRPFVLFEPARPIPRELYFGHDALFALTPGTLLELAFELEGGVDRGKEPRRLLWEYWDGEAWVPFLPFRSSPEADGCVNPSEDGTRGLTVTGVVRLRVGDRPARPTALLGLTSSWVRARRDDDASADTPDLRLGLVQARTVIRVGGYGMPQEAHDPKAKTDAKTGVPVNRVRFIDESGNPLIVATLPPNNPVAPSREFWVATATVDPERLGPATEPREGWAPWIRKKLPALVGYPLSMFAAMADAVRGAVAASPEPIRLSEVMNVKVKDSDARVYGNPDDLTWLYIDNFTGTQLAFEVRGVDGVWRSTEALTSYPMPRDVEIVRRGRLPELAFANGVRADLSKSFFPFGSNPAPGAACHFACAEVLSRPGAVVTLFLQVIDRAELKAPLPRTAWEYWNGDVWAPLPGLTGDDEVLAFRRSGEVGFRVPANLRAKAEFGESALWVRIQVREGGYTREVVANPNDDDKKKIKVTLPAPLALSIFRLEYVYESPFEPPQHCFSCSDFRWNDHSQDVQFRSQSFAPFRAPQETRPTLYLGFSRTLPQDKVSLFFDAESAGSPPRLVWEYHDGLVWQSLIVADRTRGLTSPGLVTFLWPGSQLPQAVPARKADGTLIQFGDPREAARFRPGDTLAVQQENDAAYGVVDRVEGATLTLRYALGKSFSAPEVIGPPAPLPRFDTPRHWVRVSWPETPAGDSRVTVRGVYLNAVWATQTTTSLGEQYSLTKPNESVRLNSRPVQSGEQVEMLELDGTRAAYEWAVLEEELRKLRRPGSGAGLAMRKETDPPSGRVTRVWVTWEGRENFLASGPRDRHYVVDREQGLLQFGNGRQGMLPPLLSGGTPNVNLARYQAGGGAAGNVPAGAINQLLASVPGVVSVRNPLRAEGGADGEALQGDDGWSRVQGPLDRGSLLVQHRYQAVAAGDYEALAREASATVAVARALSPVRAHDPLQAGTVRVVVVPTAPVEEAKPMPSRELLRRVQDHLSARAAAGAVEAVGPTYFAIDVEATVVPRAAEVADSVLTEARHQVGRFLHPVVGGPGGRGWSFGQALLEANLVRHLFDTVEGLERVVALRFLRGGVPLGERVDVPPEQFMAAGTVTITLGETEAQP